MPTARRRWCPCAQAKSAWGPDTSLRRRHPGPPRSRGARAVCDQCRLVRPECADGVQVVARRFGEGMDRARRVHRVFLPAGDHAHDLSWSRTVWITPPPPAYGRLLALVYVMSPLRRRLVRRRDFRVGAGPASLGSVIGPSIGLMFTAGEHLLHVDHVAAKRRQPTVDQRRLRNVMIVPVLFMVALFIVLDVHARRASVHRASSTGCHGQRRSTS